MPGDPYRSWQRHADLVKLLKDAARERPIRVRLSTGEETTSYLDVKSILTTRWRMSIAAEVMCRWMNNLGFEWPTAIGGPTMGADVLSHAIVMQSTKPFKWFSVRDHPKVTHGLGKWIEGAALGPKDEVILTDDVANSGQSLIEAYEIVSRTGAKVLAVMPLVDRAGVAAARFEKLPTIYCPVITNSDLGIGPLRAASSL